MPTVKFDAVATIVRNNCAEGQCHGEPAAGGQGFEIGANGSEASNFLIEQSFQAKTKNGEEVPLIVANKPEESGIYQAIEGLNGRLPMPADAPDDFPDEKAETIKNWILQGAKYE